MNAPRSLIASLVVSFALAACGPDVASVYDGPEGAAAESDLKICRAAGKTCGWGLGTCCAGLVCGDTGDHTHFACSARNPGTGGGTGGGTGTGGGSTGPITTRTYTAAGLPMPLLQYDRTDKAIAVTDTGIVPGKVTVHVDAVTKDQTLLIVTLVHDGRFVVVSHNGGTLGTPNLVIDVPTGQFAGSKLQGDWTLQVRDTYTSGYSTALRGFSVTVDGSSTAPAGGYGTCDLIGAPCDWRANNILGHKTCCAGGNGTASCLSSGASTQGYCAIDAFSQSMRPGYPTDGNCAQVFQHPTTTGPCCAGLRSVMVNWGIYACYP